MRARDTPGVVAPPALIYLAFLGLGLLLGYVWPRSLASGLAPIVRHVVGGGLAALGGATVLASLREFRRARTPAEPWKPAATVVTSGPFRYSRNPMYVGLTLVYVGLAVLFDSLWTLVLVVPLVLVIRYGVIAREEPYMERKFGQAYRDYRAAVRRWL